MNIWVIFKRPLSLRLLRMHRPCPDGSYQQRIRAGCLRVLTITNLPIWETVFKRQNYQHLMLIATDPLHDASNGMNPYRNNYEAADDMMNSSAAQASNMPGPPQFSQMTAGLNSAASGIVNNFMQELSGSGSSNQVTNPLVSAQGFGESLLITAQVVYPVTLLVLFLLLVAGNISFMALGTGMPTAPLAAGLQFTGYALFTIIMAFCGWCITFGSMLAIYTPLIPYILFIFGSLGWFISTLEAMVAAPFVALGILSPGGQHEILGRAEPAVMILLNIFLRPSLMIFGMMGGMLLAPVAVSILNSTFLGVMGSINSSPGIIELIVFISAYATLVVTAMNKCFCTDKCDSGQSIDLDWRTSRWFCA